MRNITQDFGGLLLPFKAFVLYDSDDERTGVYVESFDFNPEGYMINAHPLSVKEAAALSEALAVETKTLQQYLRSTGLLPPNVLYVEEGHGGFAIWHTPPMKVQLLFADSLKIPSGEAFVPALVWKATNEELTLLAIKNRAGLSLDTPLHCAPFFNIHPNHAVCMGTVRVDIASDCDLENFIQLWQQYFFNSYFTHLIRTESPVNGNIAQLWKNLIGTNKQFPLKALKPAGITLKKLRNG